MTVTGAAPVEGPEGTSPVAPPIRVLVVDDSGVIRRLVRSVLDDDPGIEVVGTASDGAQAVLEVERLSPDLVTLDVEMPVMDGVATLAQLHARWPHLPVIMFSGLTARGAAITLEALSAGAADYVTKPSGNGDLKGGLESVRAQLIPKVKVLVGRPPVRRAAPAPVAPRPTPPAPPSRFAPSARRQAPHGGSPSSPGAPGAAGGRDADLVERPGGGPAPSDLRSSSASATAPRQARSRFGLDRAAPVAPTRARRGAGAVATPDAAGTSSVRPDLVVIGVSTGGPNALEHIVPALPADLRVPVLIVQHMPPVFTGLLAERLDERSAVSVVEGEHGMELRPGRVIIAPGGLHMTVSRSRGGPARVQLNEDPPVNSCRPAVDVLFRSVALAYGKRALGLILTGMGRDGLEGTRELRAAGAAVLAQDEATSVVWGMPGAVVGAGLASQVIALDDVVAAVLARVTH